MRNFWSARTRCCSRKVDTCRITSAAQRHKFSLCSDRFSLRRDSQSSGHVIFLLVGRAAGLSEVSRIRSLPSAVVMSLIFWFDRINSLTRDPLHPDSALTEDSKICYHRLDVDVNGRTRNKPCSTRSHLSLPGHIPETSSGKSRTSSMHEA